MEPNEMGRVITEVTLENVGDLWTSAKGLIRPEEVRRITIQDALVDTGATYLSVPTRYIRQLGLMRSSTKLVTSSAGPYEAHMYAAVRMTIQGRWLTLDVLEVPDDVPVLIGQIPLEGLDFMVDPLNGKLVGRHGDEELHDMYCHIS